MTTETNPRARRLETGAKVAGFVIRRSVSGTVAAVATKNLQTENRLQKAQIAVGSFVLADMAAKAAWTHVKNEFNETVAQVKAHRQEKAIEEAKKTSTD